MAGAPPKRHPLTLLGSSSGYTTKRSQPLLEGHARGRASRANCPPQCKHITPRSLTSPAGTWHWRNSSRCHLSRCRTLLRQPRQHRGARHAHGAPHKERQFLHFPCVKSSCAAEEADAHRGPELTDAAWCLFHQGLAQTGSCGQAAAPMSSLPRAIPGTGALSAQARLKAELVHRGMEQLHYK